MAQLLTETFTGAPGAALETYNPAWAKVSGTTGTMQISSTGDRAVLLSGASAWYYRSNVTPPTPDYSVSADVYIASTTAGKNTAITFRGLATESTGYGVRVLVGTGISLIRYTAGVTAVLVTSGYSFTSMEAVNVKGVISGNSLSVYVNGVLVLGPITDSNIAGAGYIGMRATTSSGSQLQVDNLTAETLGAAVSPHVLSIGPTSQAASAPAVAIQQRHRLVIGATSQTASTPVVTARQRHALAVGATTQAAIAPTITLKQRHRLVLAPTVQRASAPLVGLGVVAAPIGLVLQSAAQRASAPAITLRQRHRLVLAALVQRSSAPAIALGHAAPATGDIDATLVPAARRVVFEGSRRVVVFPGNKRVVTFEGSKRIVRF